MNNNVKILFIIVFSKFFYSIFLFFIKKPQNFVNKPNNLVLMCDNESNYLRADVDYISYN